MNESNQRIVSLHAGYEADGEFVEGYVARPADGKPRPGVVLLSGMSGLTWTQREITRLYARAGFVALSPDFMESQPQGRTAALLAKNSLDVNRAADHIVAGADFLRTLPWVGPEGRVGIVGFCLGGGLALLAARTDRFQAGVIYHHSLFPDTRELEAINCRLLCHYGTSDHSTPREEVEAFAKTLDQYDKDYEICWYEGMGHSFAQITPDADVPSAQRAAATLSEKRTFEFLWRELGAPADQPSGSGPMAASEATPEATAPEA
jgi:carboxymethylenebutenolidase